jgi:hypothetical protein
MVGIDWWCGARSHEVSCDPGRHPFNESRVVDSGSVTSPDNKNIAGCSIAGWGSRAIGGRSSYLVEVSDVRLVKIQRDGVTTPAEDRLSFVRFRNTIHTCVVVRTFEVTSPWRQWSAHCAVAAAIVPVTVVPAAYIQYNAGVPL